MIARSTENEMSNVITLAGCIRGFRDGVGKKAKFNLPSDVVVDAAGNVYVADSSNHAIRKITPEGVVSTIAGGMRGFADGNRDEARFAGPAELAMDAKGNIYVADSDLYNYSIRKITPEGVVSTLAGVVSTLAGSGKAGFILTEFHELAGLATDRFDSVYVADAGNDSIRKITSEGEVSTLAGDGKYGFRDGVGKEARFKCPSDVVVDAKGNLYVADTDNHRIRKITPEGVVSTLAGGTRGFSDGTGTEAWFNSPSGVAVDNSGNVYVADSVNNRVRKITPDGVVSTLAGNGTRGFRDGVGTEAWFHSPHGLAVDSSNNVYVADTGNHRIRKITPEGEISTLAGSGKMSP